MTEEEDTTKKVTHDMLDLIDESCCKEEPQNNMIDNMFKRTLDISEIMEVERLRLDELDKLYDRKKNEIFGPIFTKIEALSSSSLSAKSLSWEDPLVASIKLEFLEDQLKGIYNRKLGNKQKVQNLAVSPSKTPVPTTTSPKKKKSRTKKPVLTEEKEKEKEEEVEKTEEATKDKDKDKAPQRIEPNTTPPKRPIRYARRTIFTRPPPTDSTPATEIPDTSKPKESDIITSKYEQTLLNGSRPFMVLENNSSLEDDLVCDRNRIDELKGILTSKYKNFVPHDVVENAIGNPEIESLVLRVLNICSLADHYLEKTAIQTPDPSKGEKIQYPNLVNTYLRIMQLLIHTPVSSSEDVRSTWEAESTNPLFRYPIITETMLSNIKHAFERRNAGAYIIRLDPASSYTEYQHNDGHYNIKMSVDYYKATEKKVTEIDANFETEKKKLNDTLIKNIFLGSSKANSSIGRVFLQKAPVIATAKDKRSVTTVDSRDTLWKNVSRGGKAKDAEVQDPETCLKTFVLGSKLPLVMMSTGVPQWCVKKDSFIKALGASFCRFYLVLNHENFGASGDSTPVLLEVLGSLKKYSIAENTPVEGIELLTDIDRIILFNKQSADKGKRFPSRVVITDVLVDINQYEASDTTEVATEEDEETILE